MTIMITGGTGNLGSALAQYLVQERLQEGVVLFDRYPDTARIGEILDRVHVVQGDVLEGHDLLRAIGRSNVDAIVHLAFLMGTGNPDPDAAVPYLRVLTEGTANVFEAARVSGVRRVVFASSAAVYGWPGDHGWSAERGARENDPCRPRHTYGWSKLWGEGVAEWFNETHDMEIISLRLCHTFGNGGPNSVRAGLSSRPTPSFTTAPELFAAGLPVTVPPEDQLTDFLHVADAAQGFCLAATAPLPEHRVFNLRAEQRPVGDFVRHLRRLYPDATISVRDRTAARAPLQIMENARMIAELGFAPVYSVEAALDAYAQTARRRAAH